MIRLFATLPLFAIAPQAHADLGEVLPASLWIDLNPPLFDDLTDSIPLPPPTPVPFAPITASDAQGCAQPPGTGCAFAYDVEITQANALLTTESLSVRPTDSGIEVDVRVSGSFGTEANPARLEATGELAFTPLAPQTCRLWTDQGTVNAIATLQLELAPDPDGLDLDDDGEPDTFFLQVADLELSDPMIDLAADAINVTDCGLENPFEQFETVFDALGFDLFTFIAGLFDLPTQQIADTLVDQVNPILEGVLDDLIVNQQVDIGDSTIDVAIWPTVMETRDEGIRIASSVIIDAETAACTQGFAAELAPVAPSVPPPLGFVSSPFDQALSVLFDRDVANHALFAVWRAGGLCTTFDSIEGSPIPLNTAVLGLLAPGAFDGVFTSIEPLQLALTAASAPTVVFDPAGPVSATAPDLRLSFLARLRARTVRLLAYSVDATLPLSITGEPPILLFDLLASPSTLIYNEFRPDSGAALQSGFDDWLALLTPALTGALGGGIEIPLQTGTAALQTAGIDGDIAAFLIEELALQPIEP